MGFSAGFGGFVLKKKMGLEPFLLVFCLQVFRFLG